ncbi:TadE/TadG family type IV pilus assembly protein [Nitratireductor sp. GISD-1A_MAKvit]|uniref:TadE/TadG family type IV pilus assembly protein n=1 Tax=Nitratireductor sp. GISD-1A_MAKvit TaxID=3234198 RepID=UPI00346645CC
MRGFIKNRDGATAVEFAILIFPFLLLVFIIVESSIAFAAQQLLTNATDDVARLFRTGQEQRATLNETKLHKMICDRISMLMTGDCPGLAVDLRQFDSFEDAAKASQGFNPDGSFDTRLDLGPALSKNMIRVYYRWPVITNILADQLPDGKMLLFSTSTWQNEPF